MALFEVLTVIFVILYFLNYLINNTKRAKILQNAPGPPPLPIIGNLADFLLNPVQLFYKLRYLASNYKKFYVIKAFHYRILNIFNPQDIEIILSSSKHITKSHIYNMLHPWLKQGLLTSDGGKWQSRRKILTPAFHFNILQQFCKIFDEQSKNLIEKLKLEPDKSKTDVVSLITQFALNSICETSMGTQLNENNTHNKYKDAIYEMGHIVVYRLQRIWYHTEFIFNFTYLGKKQKKNLSILHNFTTAVIENRRQNFLKENAQNVSEQIEDDEFMSKTKKRLAMLDLLLSAERDGKINKDGIREEVDTFMFEGHDTTTVGISFCLMLLANHKDIQDRIVDELDDIFHGSDRAATMGDLNNMNYLEMCIKEALRLYPSVPFISRTIHEDLQLTNCVVPSETDCQIHIFDLHRDPEIYPMPDKFIPERFTQENSSKRHPYAYIPFSAGPRNCIGQRFAIYEEKSVISRILRNFKLECVTTPKDIVFSSDIVLRCVNPIYIKFIPRR